MTEVADKEEFTKSYFRITGEFITSHARDLVKEDNWQDALHWLVDCMDGMTYDYAIAILSGESKLVGKSQIDGKDEGITLAKDDDKEYKEYLKWKFDGCWHDRHCELPANKFASFLTQRFVLARYNCVLA